MKTVKITFRFPVKQINAHQVEVVAGSNGIPILNGVFVSAFQLSDSEVELAEDKVVRALVVMPEDTAPEVIDALIHPKATLTREAERAFNAK
jgi:hypothetical protein